MTKKDEQRKIEEARASRIARRTRTYKGHASLQASEVLKTKMYYKTDWYPPKDAA